MLWKCWKKQEVKDIVGFDNEHEPEGTVYTRWVQQEWGGDPKTSVLNSH